jgi:dGTPase
MVWTKFLNQKKLGKLSANNDLGRSAFHSDYDKIAFSGAFRRLAKKTQVHPLATNDHVHNRLTHSLEVSCVGRSLGTKIGCMLQEKERLPDNFRGEQIGEIVQAACLAHDIGNPPFGHTGEDAIRHWFEKEGSHYLEKLTPNEKSDLTHFEGNAQGLRVLTTSEYHSYDGGMRLTYATLGAFIKYPWTSAPSISGDRPKSNKYGVFQSELRIFEEISEAIGVTKRGDHWYSRHPLVYLMEAADDFCYALLDLEDGLEMGILKWDQVFEIIEPCLKKEDAATLRGSLDKYSLGRRPSLVRGKIIESYINSAAKAFIENEELFLEGVEADLISHCDDKVRDSVNKAKTVAKDEIFTHPRKIELEIGSYNTIATLLKVMCEAAIEYADAQDISKLSFRSKRVIELIGANTFPPNMFDSNNARYQALMRVIDFISGMTDNYATFLSLQFNGMGGVR